MKYRYDEKTGGLLLTAEASKTSKEPRPVYSQELDTLGFDKYWKYDKQTDQPYMWAEANRYYYRGVLVAKLKGGSIYTAPEVSILEEGEGLVLKPVDIEAMVEANREKLEIIELSTAKGVYAMYKKHKGHVDCFHVAFSGGKDSCVLLDVVKNALPKGSFTAVFGDTGMEFPDTAEVIEKTKQQCNEDGTPFYIAKSHFSAQESWKLFGHPSRVLRWCCSVHKSTPQLLKLREVYGKKNLSCVSFVGVRKYESARRSQYTIENYDKKQKGQYSHNSILDWTSAEVWLYMYTHNLPINAAYKKGHGRVGCLLCPLAGMKSNFVTNAAYPDEVGEFVDIIKNNHDPSYAKEGDDTHSYIVKNGWSARVNSRDLKDNPLVYMDKVVDKTLTIAVANPKTDWQEWVKAIGDFAHVSGDKYSISFDGETVFFTVKPTSNGYIVEYPKPNVRKGWKYRTFKKLLRRAFKRAAYCVGCRTCEANCPYGCVSFGAKGVSVNDYCRHCHRCFDTWEGCLAAHSRKVSGISRSKNKKSCW